MKQEIIEEVYLSQLGLSKKQWNIAKHLMCQQPDGYKWEEFTLEKVVSDENLKETVLFEVQSAERMYKMAINDSYSKGNKKLHKTLSDEYKKLCSETR